MAVILAYQLSGQQLAGLRVIAVRLGARVRVVKRGEYSVPVGVLAQGGTEEGTEGPPLEGPMLLFAGFTGGGVQQFLQAWRQARLAPVSCKAMLTETNRAWDAYALFRELSAEHRAIRAGRQEHYQ